MLVEHGEFNIATSVLSSQSCPDFKSDQAERDWAAFQTRPSTTSNL